jgi:hypothetical protein
VPDTSTFLHVSSVLNRASIAKHGLDWTRMGPAQGIAGSSRPEVDGIFICRGEDEARFFVRINNTGGPVDIWTRGCAERIEHGALVKRGEPRSVIEPSRHSAGARQEP